MDVDALDSTQSDSLDRHADSDVGGSPYEGRGAKRIRPPPVTKLIKWNDLPNWYSRKDQPLLDLPHEILDRIFSLDTGLEVSEVGEVVSNARSATTSRLPACPAPSGPFSTTLCSRCVEKMTPTACQPQAQVTL